MKREFGKRLIEESIPHWDVTHVVDTSGAYIPGHGTPTVLLLGRHRGPVEDVVRAVMGIRGEPSTPDDPAKALVWSAIVAQIDRVGSQSEFVSVSDVPRERFHRHPWSTGGAGASELKELIEGSVAGKLGELADSIGITSFTLEDDIFLLPTDAAWRKSLPSDQLREMVVGNAIRDWRQDVCGLAAFPYDAEFSAISDDPTHPVLRYLWMARVNLANNRMFGAQTKIQAGLRWYEYGRLTSEKLRTPLSIAFAFVATHNHFVLDRGGKVFNRSAPVIKLPAGASENDHVGLLGLLNSSTACFWMKQVMSCKGLGGQGGGIKPEDWHRAYEFDSSKISRFPIPAEDLRLTELATMINDLAEQVSKYRPDSVIESARSKADFDRARGQFEKTIAQMVAVQEEIDWLVYSMYGLCDYERAAEEDLLRGLHPEQRPAETLFRERLGSGAESIFYDVHRYRGVDAQPDLSSSMWSLIDRRTKQVEASPSVALIEDLNTKRRWQFDPWETQQDPGASTLAARPHGGAGALGGAAAHGRQRSLRTACATMLSSWRWPSSMRGDQTSI